MANFDYDFCVIKISFPYLARAHECMNLMMSQKLFAHATVTKICSYNLQLDDDEETLKDYLVDENAVGVESADIHDDFLLEVYTTKRLEGKIKNLIETGFEQSITTYSIVPIIDASRKLRRLFSKLNVYHAKDMI